LKFSLALFDSCAIVRGMRQNVTIESAPAYYKAVAGHTNSISFPKKEMEVAKKTSDAYLSVVIRQYRQLRDENDPHFDKFKRPLLALYEWEAERRGLKI
jgi:hypothetical protein